MKRVYSEQADDHGITSVSATYDFDREEELTPRACELLLADLRRSLATHAV